MSRGTRNGKPSYKTRIAMEAAEGRDWINAAISNRGTFYMYRDESGVRNFFIKSYNRLDRPKIEPTKSYGCGGNRF